MIQCDFSCLSPGTRTQYARVLKWFRLEYKGPWHRTEPMQCFLNALPNPRGIRGRVLRCILNQHIRPKAEGPELTLRQSAPTTSKCNAGRSPSDRTLYLPVHLRSTILTADTFWSTRTPNEIPLEIVSNSMMLFIASLGACPL